MLGSLSKDENLKASSGKSVVVEKLLGSGGQGEVYRVKVNDNKFALKWYSKQTATKRQKEILTYQINMGMKDQRFLWPMEFVTSSSHPGLFGYLMPLRPDKFEGVPAFAAGKVDIDFSKLCLVGFNLAEAFLNLHSSGFAYQDISFGNIFFDPQNGDVLICDNDNVVLNGELGEILGTQRFMAPEIVLGKQAPDTLTDQFSLGILLFYIFFLHHPLEGAQEAAIKCYDSPGQYKVFGEKPVFIFHPTDGSNRPVPGVDGHDNAILYWGLYPDFFRKPFIKTFTDGIRDRNERTTESEWRKYFIQLKDQIIYCPCGRQNFYDQEKLKLNKKLTCWDCRKQLPLPYRMKLDESGFVMLNYDTVLYPHHLDPFDHPYELGEAWAKVVQHPKDPQKWGLHNFSPNQWTVTYPGKEPLNVAPGKTAPLISDMQIHFGKVKGIVRY